MLVAEKKIRSEMVEKLLSWKKFRFSVHHQVKIQSGIAGAGKAWPSTSFARRFLWKK